MGKDVYVVKAGSRWRVRVEGKNNPLSTHRTQELALDKAEPIAKRNKSELRIQGRDHKWVDADSYGKDPNPPRDTKH